MDLCVPGAWCLVFSGQLSALALPCLLPALWKKHCVICSCPTPFLEPGTEQKNRIAKSSCYTPIEASAAKTVSESRHRYCPRYSKRAQASTLKKKKKVYFLNLLIFLLLLSCLCVCLCEGVESWNYRQL